VVGADCLGRDVPEMSATLPDLRDRGIAAGGARHVDAGGDAMLNLLIAIGGIELALAESAGLRAAPPLMSSGDRSDS